MQEHTQAENSYLSLTTPEYAGTTFMVSNHDQLDINPAGTEIMAPTMTFGSGEEAEDVSPIDSPADAATAAPIGTLKVINAHAGSDKGGTIYLKTLEPFLEGIRKLPMYTVFEAKVRFPNCAEIVQLFGYTNRYSLSSYWGDRLIANGKKFRVVWIEKVLARLPGKSESIQLDVIAFALRDESNAGKVVA